MSNAVEEHPRNNLRDLIIHTIHKEVTGRVIIVGDVHGCPDQLRELARKLFYDETKDLLILAGDLVNKGPDSRGAVQAAIDLGAKCVLGNHDATVLELCEEIHAKELDELSWKASRFVGVARDMTDDCVQYLQQLPHVLKVPQHNLQVLHAGLNLSYTLEEQNICDVTHLRRLEWNDEKNRYDGIFTGAQGVPWAKLYNGPDTVVFGHDAKSGLQNETFAIGLDTNCCYGGELTAVVFPGRKFVSVPGLPQKEKQMKVDEVLDGTAIAAPLGNLPTSDLDRAVSQKVLAPAELRSPVLRLPSIMSNAVEEHPRNNLRDLIIHTIHKEVTGRVIIVGDVHGCPDQLRELARKLFYDETKDLLILAGDLVNKGPDSLGAVQAAIDLGAKCVLGNHDATVLELCEEIHAKELDGLSWKASRDPALLVARSMTDDCVQYLQQLPHVIKVPQYNLQVLHAGLNLSYKLEEQSIRDVTHLRRLEWNDEKNRYDGISKGAHGDLWAKLYNGPEIVVFGHDAKSGLQNEKFAIGLDTNCCFGGALTAVVFPGREFVSVPGLPQKEKQMKVNEILGGTAPLGNLPTSAGVLRLLCKPAPMACLTKRPEYPDSPQIRTPEPNWPPYASLGVHVRADGSASDGTQMFVVDWSDERCVSAQSLLERMSDSDVDWMVKECKEKFPFHLPTLVQLHCACATMGDAANSHRMLDMALYTVGVLLPRDFFAPSSETQLRPQLLHNKPANRIVFETLKLGVQRALKRGDNPTAFNLHRLLLSLDITDPCATLLSWSYLAVRAQSWDMILNAHNHASLFHAQLSEGAIEDNAPTPHSDVARLHWALPGAHFCAALAKLAKEQLEPRRVNRASSRKQPRNVIHTTPTPGTPDSGALMALAMLRFPHAAWMLAEKLDLEINANIRAGMARIYELLRELDAGEKDPQNIKVAQRVATLFVEQHLELFRPDEATELFLSGFARLGSQAVNKPHIALERQEFASTHLLRRFRASSLADIVGDHAMVSDDEREARLQDMLCIRPEPDSHLCSHYDAELGLKPLGEVPLGMLKEVLLSRIEHRQRAEEERDEAINLSDDDLYDVPSDYDYSWYDSDDECLTVKPRISFVKMGMTKSRRE